MIKMILINTGDGKGKTTAALGLALRALGNNQKVAIVQFMKGRTSGENKITEKLSNLQDIGYEIYQFGRQEFVDLKNPDRQDIELAKKGLNFTHNYIENLRDKTKHTLLILDEINIAVSCGLLSEEDVLDFLAKARKIENLDIVMTGRNASKRLIKEADIVTEMKEKKYKQGTRKGIEY